MQTFVLLMRRSLAGSQALLPLFAYAASACLLLVLASGVHALSTASWFSVEFQNLYKVLALIASCLLVVPLFALGASAARLSARRREDRLSVLSLLGASSQKIAFLSVGESMIYALAGSLLGWVAHYLLLIPISWLHFQGAPLGYSSLLLPVGIQLLLGGLLMLLALASSLLGISKLSVSPLAVRTRSNTPTLSKVGLVTGVLALIIAAAFSIANVTGSAGTNVVLYLVFVLAPLLLGVLAVDLLGGFFTGLYAKVRIATARTPEKLLAFRAIAESPRAVWRQISGVAVTTFISVVVTVSLSAINVGSAQELTGEEAYLMVDLRTGILLTVGISFLLVAVSASLNQVANIYERAPLYSSLHMLGFGVSELQKSRRAVILGPVLLVSLFSAACGYLLCLPILGLSAASPQSLLIAVFSVSATIGAGLALVYASLAVSARPLKIIAMRPTSAV